MKNLSSRQTPCRNCMMVMELHNGTRCGKETWKADAKCTIHCAPDTWDYAMSCFIGRIHDPFYITNRAAKDHRNRNNTVVFYGCSENSSVSVPGEPVRFFRPATLPMKPVSPFPRSVRGFRFWRPRFQSAVNIQFIQGQAFFFH